MKHHRVAVWGLVSALLLAGCGQPPGELTLQRLDPSAPAAQGLPALRGPDQPSPLTERPPFGLYAHYPTNDTLAALARGELSPDGRFRAAVTPQGAWIARVDGAWLWQIQVPESPAPAPAPGQTKPGQTATPPPQAETGPGLKPGAQSAPKLKPVTVSGAPEWTPRNTLLFKDHTGTWFEAEPETARVAALPAALQGKEISSFSPDGKQVLYYVNGKTGKQLWVAKVDGSDARLLGENVIGSWDAQSKPVVKKVTPEAPGTQTTDPARDFGPKRE